MAADTAMVGGVGRGAVEGDATLFRDAAAALDDLAGRLEAAEQHASALERDLAWWKAHCEAVTRDWKADCEELARLRSVDGAEAPGGRSAEAQDAERALAELLRFYDAETGALRLREGSRSLVEAFARAADCLKLGSERHTNAA